jgi:hypothetical protein
VHIVLQSIAVILEQSFDFAQGQNEFVHDVESQQPRLIRFPAIRSIQIASGSREETDYPFRRYEPREATWTRLTNSFARINDSEEQNRGPKVEKESIE